MRSRRVLTLSVAAAFAGLPLVSAMQMAKAPKWAQGVDVAPVTVGAAPNSSSFGKLVYFAGQPSESDLAEYSRLGVKTVINLRTPGEMEKLGFAEDQAVKRAGMTYLSVPMGGTLPDQAELDKVFAVLGHANEQKVLLHCASSVRVGAVWALFRGSRHGLDADAAFAEGKAAGLKSANLEKLGRERLAGAAKP